MLVLSRKTGERIHIGDDIFVEVRRVSGNRVTLAVKAPREVRILRGELFDAADSCSVLDEPHILDEPHTEESAKDTVIMKHVQSEPTSSVPTPHIVVAPKATQKVKAK